MRIEKKLLSKILFILVFFLMSVGSLSSIYATGSGSIFIPAACPRACNEDTSTNCYVPDTKCINEKFFDPSSTCEENKCRGTGSADNPDEITTLLNAFGTKLIVKTNDPFALIATLVNLAITTFLGFVSIYAIIYGVYVGGVKRARSIDDGEIAEANKTLLTLIGGFILAWSFIFIIQIVASIIGLGSLNNLQLIDDSGSTGETITIQ